MANIFTNFVSNITSYFEQDENDVEEIETDEVYEETEEYEDFQEEEEVVQEEQEVNYSPQHETNRDRVDYTQRERSVVSSSQQNLTQNLHTQSSSSSDRPHLLSQRTVKENKVSPLQSRQEQSVPETEEKTTIVLKYPRRYEDATEIVDLLIENECILIDFQFMLDAQARRCLDYLDGASHVLYGKLQKVGSTMYLLTPMNVTVDIEDMSISNSGQDMTYDYDMKRR